MFSHLWGCNLFSPFDYLQGALFSLQILSPLHVLRVTCCTQTDMTLPQQYDTRLTASSMRGLQLAPVLRFGDQSPTGLSDCSELLLDFHKCSNFKCSSFTFILITSVHLHAYIVTSNSNVAFNREFLGSF